MSTAFGKPVSDEILQKIAGDLTELKKGGILPLLAIITSNNNHSGLSFMKQKEKYCNQLGIHCKIIKISSRINHFEFLKILDSLNNDKSVHGIVIQLPLPAHIDFREICQHINPIKDIDGFHPLNRGKILTDITSNSLYSCTAKAVLKFADYYKIYLEGKNITVIGHSAIVGKPLVVLLLNRNATVSCCHIFTKDIKPYCRQADIVISAVGKCKLITSDMVKKGTICIDVGCSIKDGKLYGDFDFENIRKKATLITPVPGGIGPITSIVLLENLITAVKLQIQNSKFKI